MTHYILFGKLKKYRILAYTPILSWSGQLFDFKTISGEAQEDVETLVMKYGTRETCLVLAGQGRETRHEGKNQAWLKNKIRDRKSALVQEGFIYLGATT